MSAPTSAGSSFDASRFTRFEYSGFSVSADGSRFAGHYALTGPGDRLAFTERVTVPATGAGGRSPTATPLHRLLFLACGLSYYKAAAPPVIEVPGGLARHEVDFLRSLVRHGLGEFAYRNDLPGSLEPEIRAPATDVGGVARDDDWSVERAPLVAVGGGKDSVVSLELLARAGTAPVAFSVNGYDPITACVEVSGCRYLQATRRLDPELMAANRAGAHNGHVPVTAVNSLVALVTADTAGLGPVVMSNESSAEDGNLRWEGYDVNHQWSKSLAFETLLRDAMAAGGLVPDRYFSLLRPFSELAIARMFATATRYFPAFTSCNRLFTLDPATRRTSWCCQCAKCRFVFLVLAPFVPRETLTDVFGADILADPGHEAAYREILGLSGHKPFDCVGDDVEARVALAMVADRGRWSGSPLVAALTGAVDTAGLRPTAEEARQTLDGLGPHHVPPRFQQVLGVRRVAA